MEAHDTRTEEEILAELQTGGGPTPPDDDTSAMDRLRKARQEIQEQTYIDLSIPGYGGELIGRHRAVEFAEMREWGREITKQIRDPDEQQMKAAVDVIARTCTGIYLRPKGAPLDSEPIPLDPNKDGIPCRFDEELAEALGFKPESPKSTDVVRGVFGDKDLLIMAYQMKYSRWLATANREVDREAGEV